MADTKSIPEPETPVNSKLSLDEMMVDDDDEDVTDYTTEEEEVNTEDEVD